MKNNNKKILQLGAVILLFALCTVSCKKFLTENPVTEIGTDVSFGDNEHALKAVLGAYSYMTGDRGYGIRLNLYYPMGTDECMNPSENNDNGRRSISRYETLPSNTELNAADASQRPFAVIYKGIEMANICIENVPKMKTFGSSIETKRLYGEALTLRANYYLELIRNWGDVPGVFKPAAFTALSDPYPQKMDRDLIYDQLLADLLIAESNVPWRTEVAADERITKGAVKALRARIALYRAGFGLRRSPVDIIKGSNALTYYTIARDECREIMARPDQHDLAPNIRTLFKNYVCGIKTPNDPTGELMFQVAMAGGSSAADSKMGYACGPRQQASVGSTTFNGNAFVLIQPTAFYLFDSVDMRRDVSVAPYDLAYDGVTKVGQKLVALRDGKFRKDWISPISTTGTPQYFGVNWPLIRFSDVLLMFAEAENEINGAPTADAIAAFEKVRKRGFLGHESEIGVTPTSKTGFFDAIVKERLLEFMGEGFRKYDLNRWGILKEKIQETKDNLLKMRDGLAPYNKVPKYVYYRNNSTGDDFSIIANSLYNLGPTGTIAGQTRVNWISVSDFQQKIDRFAIDFNHKKDELLPIGQQDITNSKITQDYGH